MVSEVESAHSKKWEVGSAELKANGPGFAGREQSPLPSPPVATQSKKKAASIEGGRKLHCSLYVPDIICKSGGNTLKFYL